MKRVILIFTDLDGSLLDHEGYSYENALTALAIIRARSIPWSSPQARPARRS